MSTTTAVKTTQEVANRLVALCREGKFLDAAKELYGPKVVSDEPHPGPGPMHVEGYDAVVKKTSDFSAGIEQVHSNAISDPLVADNHFAVSMSMDVTMKGAGRMKMEEIAVYEVQDGKIVSDRFFYRPMPGQN